MPKQLIKGNEAIVKSAILAGCRAFYGYPITPASEIAEAAAKYMPLVGGVFLQAESETASINMLYGAAAAGLRTMTASSGPGISLMQEGLSYLAGAELPCVIADIMRAGPGLGNIAPEQGDYNQVVKGGGHGCYKTIVLAPDCVQEMADLTALAFDLADEYLNPVFVLADGAIGQAMEPVEFMAAPIEPRSMSWAVEGTAATRAKYKRCEREAVRCEQYQTAGAEIVLIGYGITARILKAVVEQLRAEGLPVGLLRPITLYPFPVEAIRGLAAQAKVFGVVELSTGQMVDDVKLALNGIRPVEFYGRVGGNVPSAEEVAQVVRHIATQYAVTARSAEPLEVAHV